MTLREITDKMYYSGIPLKDIIALTSAVLDFPVDDDEAIKRRGTSSARRIRDWQEENK